MMAEIAPAASLRARQIVAIKSMLSVPSRTAREDGDLDLEWKA
jgi:hypothetical protein